MKTIVMTQEADYPTVLKQLVDELEYKAGWHVSLHYVDRGQSSRGLTLVIVTNTVDSYHPDQLQRVTHYMPVPPAAYDVRSWQRWLLEQILLVESHEVCEFFTIAGVKPYAPSHGPGNSPYLIREIGTELDVKTSFRGEVKS